MGLFDRFKTPKWKHEDPKIRLEGVKELYDQKTLISLATSDPDENVRYESIKRIRNDSYLAEIILNSHDEKIKLKALNGIEKDSVKVKIALNALTVYGFPVRKMANNKLGGGYESYCTKKDWKPIF